MALIIPNSIENDTPADAAELQQNFTEIQTYVNTNLVNRDGSVALTQPLLLPGDPTLPNHAANKDYVDGRDLLKVAKAGDTMTGPLILSGDPTVDTHAAHKAYVDTKVAKAGDTITGALTVNGAVTCHTNPTVANHLARKDYVDGQVSIAYGYADSAHTVAAAKVAKTGDQMSGDLIVGLGSPFASSRGCELTASGVVGTQRSVAGVNIQVFKQGAAFASGQHYQAFYGQTTATVLGAITQVGSSGVSYNESSDYRLKDELGPIDNPTERLMQLQPKHLRWKVDDVEFDGFIAHEVDEIVPYAVTGDKDAVNDDGDIEPQQLDSSKLIPLLVATVQQLAARVAELEAA